MIKAYIDKYEYLTGKNDSLQYLENLTVTINSFDFNQLWSIYHLAIYSLYIEVNHNVSKELMNKVVNNIFTSDFKLHFYFI